VAVARIVAGMAKGRVIGPAHSATEGGLFAQSIPPLLLEEASYLEVLCPIKGHDLLLGRMEVSRDEEPA